MPVFIISNNIINAKHPDIYVEIHQVY